MLEARPPSVSAEPAAGADLARELANEVARAVRELRASAGLSERAAARALGTSQTQLRRMEDPRYLPSLRSLARVAAVYGRRLRVGFEPPAAAPPPARPPAQPKPPARDARPRRKRATRARRR